MAVSLHSLRRVAATLLATVLLWPACLAADPLEGDWQVNGGGACLRFATPDIDGDPLRVIWLDGDDWRIPPGTVIGHAVPGATPGVYDCSLSVNPAGRRRHTTATFVLRMTDDGDGLSFEAYRRNRRISLWRWIPYLFRVTVISGSNRPAGLDGARRICAEPQFIVL